MKVVDLDLSFHLPLESANFDLCSSSYGQISGWRLDLGKTTILASQQNLSFLKAELGFGVNMKFVGLFLKFLIHIKNVLIRHLEFQIWCET